VQRGEKDATANSLTSVRLAHFLKKTNNLRGSNLFARTAATTWRINYPVETSLPSHLHNARLAPSNTFRGRAREKRSGDTPKPSIKSRIGCLAVRDPPPFTRHPLR